jgi:hypothetical protein
MTILIIHPIVFKETKSEYINKGIRVINGWNIIRKEHKVVTISSIVIIAQILICSAATIISYHMSTDAMNPL